MLSDWKLSFWFSQQTGGETDVIQEKSPSANQYGQQLPASG
jgi:hypothetical protein